MNHVHAGCLQMYYVHVYMSYVVFVRSKCTYRKDIPFMSSFINNIQRTKYTLSSHIILEAADIELDLLSYNQRYLYKYARVEVIYIYIFSCIVLSTVLHVLICNVNFPLVNGLTSRDPILFSVITGFRHDSRIRVQR